MTAYSFWLGSYAGSEQPGVQRYAIDFETQSARRLAAVDGLRNPSYLLADSDTHRLYCVEETVDGAISVFDTCGASPVKLDSFPTGGADPCHLCMDGAKRVLAVANYSGSSLALFALRPNGDIAAIRQTVRHHGKGSDPDRQEAPHPHFSMFIGEALYRADLGLDRIIRYTVRQGAFSAFDAIALPAGCGLRHFCRHPSLGFLYVVCELSSQIMVVNPSQPDHPIRQISFTLPPGWEGQNSAAAIKLTDDGR
jgi:6-phosphogluconolactonase